MSNVTETPPVPITHEESSHQLRAQLRQLAQSVSGYTPIATDQRSRVGVSANVSDEFLLTVASALDGAPPQFLAAAELTSAEIIDFIRFSKSYDPMADDLLLHGQGLKDTVLTKRADIARRARRAYKLAQGLNQPKGRTPIVPHIDLMRDTLAASRKKKVVVAPKPETPATMPDMKKAA